MHFIINKGFTQIWEMVLSPGKMISMNNFPQPVDLFTWQVGIGPVPTLQAEVAIPVMKQVTAGHCEYHMTSMVSDSINTVSVAIAIYWDSLRGNERNTCVSFRWVVMTWLSEVQKTESGVYTNIISNYYIASIVDWVSVHCPVSNIRLSC